MIGILSQEGSQDPPTADWLIRNGVVVLSGKCCSKTYEYLKSLAKGYSQEGEYMHADPGSYRINMRVPSPANRRRADA